MVPVSKPRLAAVFVMLAAAGVAAQGDVLETSRKQSADPLNGAPFVNATAWALADTKSGELLWGHQQDKALPMASTTKVMTALLVAELAAKDRTVLVERVNVSRFAANTGGSSAKIRYGDRIPVGELLYGLLLPSGNDAASALAEHFGARMAPPKDRRSVPWTPRSAGRTASWVNFVAEMNRRARQLQMTRTRYVNPHGLDSQHHHSSPRDILKLAVVAMRLPELQRRFATRRHRCKVIDGTGARRMVDWTNTNKLLEIKGYLGMKTGTTPRAGSCLISCAERDGERLTLVVLNSTNRLGRYVDSRNLFRWAFQQRLAGGK